MGGKPSKGTRKDKRLKRNRRRASAVKALKKVRAFASTRSHDGRFPI